MLCDTTNVKGCARCAVKRPRLCCDLHDGVKALIDALHPPATIKPPPSKPRRSAVKDFVATPADMDLKHALHQWRVSKVMEEYGQGGLASFGPGVVMPNETLSRIVACVHEDKIKDVQDVQRETKWCGVEDYGQEVLDIIQQLRPPSSALTTTPLPMPDPSKTGAKPKRVVKCGACGQEGHNRA